VTDAETLAPAGLPETAALGWRREPASARTLRRDGRRWTAWTCWVVALFTAPGLVLLWIEPLTFPVAALCFAHAWAVPSLQARRGARSVVPIGSERSAGSGGPAGRAALGLLGDLVGHDERDLLTRSGLALQRGRMGTWLVGEQGAFLVLPPRRLRGRRVFCWCVRVGDAAGLPAGDRVAHLLLALREDEEGFATVANLAFSGARWRVLRHLEAPTRAALTAAQTGERGATRRPAVLPGRSVA
jgi:hypothetical protein